MEHIKCGQKRNKVYMTEREESNTHQQSERQTVRHIQHQEALRRDGFEPAGDETDASLEKDVRLPARTAQLDASHFSPISESESTTSAATALAIVFDANQ